MKILFGLTAILLLLSGCYTEKKAQRKLDEAYRKKEVVVAGFCSSKYPIKSDTVTNVEYKKGEVQVLPGEVKYVDCPPSKKGEKIACPPCPDGQLRVDTVYSTRFITKEDSAGKQQLRLQLKQANQGNGKFYKPAFFVSIILLGFIVYFLVRK